MVWIAEEFTEQHRAALDWLNEFINSAEKGFTGLEIQLWKIGDSLPAPKFEVISHVNETSRAIAKSVDSEKQKYRIYWLELKDYLMRNNSRLGDIKVTNEYWTVYRTGKAFFSYQLAVQAGKKNPRTEIYFRGGYINGHDVMDYIETKYKTQLENKIGEPLHFDKSYKALKSGSIRVWRDTAMDINDKKDWDACHAWYADRLDKFTRAFEPIIKTINPDDYRPERIDDSPDDE